MQILYTSEARKNLHKLVDHISETHEPTYIKGKRNTAVLISLEDWKSLSETMYLNSIPGLAESIVSASKSNDFVSEEELSEEYSFLKSRAKNV